MSLKDDRQQNIQIQLDFSLALTGEAREAGRAETESSGATSGPESPARTDRLMEEVCERENLKADDIDAIQRGFAFDVGLLALTTESIFLDEQVEMLTHLIAAQNLSHG